MYIGKLNRKIYLAAVAFVLGFASQPNAAPLEAPGKMLNGVMVNNMGMTLYTFDKDEKDKNKSACVGQCAKVWPPVIAQPNIAPSGEFSLITRDDGTKQWAYKGMPLYLYAGDQKPGDKLGDNVNNVWHVIK